MKAGPRRGRSPALHSRKAPPERGPRWGVARRPGMCHAGAESCREIGARSDARGRADPPRR
jgi:hypothetical protein